MKPRPALRVWLGGWLGIWLGVQPLLLGCAGAPRGSAAPDRSAPIFESLPADATLYAAVEAPALAHLAAPLPWITALPQWLDALGLDARRPLHLALRWGEAGAAIRAGEDARRVAQLQARDPAQAEAASAWLRAHPLPPLYAHLRIVGRPVANDLPQALGRLFGGAQLLDLDAEAAAWAEALEIPVARAVALKARLSALSLPGGGRAEGAHVARLLGFRLPVLALTRRGADRVILDWVIGLGGPEALAAGLEAVDQAPTLAAAPLRPGPGAARLRLDLASWALGLRALGAVDWLRRAAVSGPDTPEGPLQAVERRSAIALRHGAGLDLTVHLSTAGLRLTGPSAAPGEITPAPGHHDALEADAPLALTLAGGLQASGEDQALRDLLACGLPCLPALWIAGPALLGDAQAHLASALLWPALRPVAADAEGVIIARGPSGGAAMLGQIAPVAALPPGLLQGEAPGGRWFTDRPALADQLQAKGGFGGEAPRDLAGRLTLRPGPSERPLIERLDVSIWRRDASGPAQSGQVEVELRWRAQRKGSRPGFH